MAEIWLRPEFQGRENELETRTDFEKRTGISAQSLSSRFSNYADRLPKLVKRNGKLKYFVAAELDEFVAWIETNSGTRSEADVRRAELARVQNAIEDTMERVADRQRDLDKAKRDLAKYQRQAKTLKSDIEFLDQVE
ncbi:helix-turn-helix DNA-binding domain protein [Streptomyces phage Frankenweenie]|nr:helix-turn-helix DNA-binding domain protein [Streptomyces phage Frankenweenie]